jgi:hypothetical protein
MTVEQLFQYLNQFGAPLLISGLAIFLAYRYFEKKLNERPKAEPLHQDFPFDYAIQSHSILATIEVFYTSTAHNVCFPSTFKQALWSDFLSEYFHAMHDYLVEGLSKDYHALPKAKFKTATMEWLIALFPYCEDRAVEALSIYFSAQSGPAKMIVRKFNAVYRHHREQFLQQISEYLETAAFPSNKQRLAAILYSLKNNTLLVLVSAEATLSQLNGDLDGLVYKGISNEKHEST